MVGRLQRKLRNTLNRKKKTQGSHENIALTNFIFYVPFMVSLFFMCFFYVSVHSIYTFSLSPNSITTLSSPFLEQKTNKSYNVSFGWLQLLTMTDSTPVLPVLSLKMTSTKWHCRFNDASVLNRSAKISQISQKSLFFFLKF